MARKHFEQFYSKVKSQYIEIIDMMKEVSELVSKNAADPQILTNLEETLEPIKNSYLSLAYIEYLLNLPKDKQVAVRNRKQFETQLKQIDKTKTETGILTANNNHINNAKKLIDEELR